MSRTKSVLLAVVLAGAGLVLGCGKERESPTSVPFESRSVLQSEPTSPEEAIKHLLLALALGDVKSVSRLSIDPTQGTFLCDQPELSSEDKAAARQAIDQLEFKRLAHETETRPSVPPDAVASYLVLPIADNEPMPTPLWVYKIGELWRVDVGPLLVARERARLNRLRLNR